MMNVFQLNRALVDIKSITNHEEAVGSFLFATLTDLAARTAGAVERRPVEAHRFNVFPRWGDPIVTLSTHTDTVPPFFGSHEDSEFVWGRGSTDAKGIMASMISASEKRLAEGIRNFGLLFVGAQKQTRGGGLWTA